MKDGVFEVERDIKEIFKQKGFKLTTQRRAVLDVIAENEGKHLSSEEIYQQVKCKYPEIGLATIYRTLQLLEQIGVLSKLNFDDGCNRYEFADKNNKHKHHHLICLQCEKVIEFQEDLLEDLEKEILIRNNFLVSNHSVKFYGYCDECRKKNGK